MLTPLPVAISLPSNFDTLATNVILSTLITVRPIFAVRVH